MSTTVVEQIGKLLDEKFREAAFADCFLVELKASANNSKLEVFIDSDSNITFSKCQQISRYLESYLDEADWMSERYILEVSSPGIDRPLKFPRQYKKNIGRKLEVLYNKDEKRTGTLISADKEGIVLEEKVRLKEGKRKRTTVVQTSITFDSIQKAVVQISF